MEGSIIVDPTDFRRRAAPLLVDEARHNLMLGITGTIITDPDVYPDYRLFLVEAHGAPVAAAVITPPHNLIVADVGDPEAIAALARLVATADREVPGVIGNRPTVGDFAAEWTRVTGRAAHPQLGMGVYALRTVIEPPAPPGRARRAVPTDEELLVEWIMAFSAEALPHESTDRPDVATMVRRRVREDGPAAIWLWVAEGGRPLAMSGYGNPTGSGIRISLVYTPPAQRGRGYATALVASQSAWLLANGFGFCFLFTDLANPTSNAIYERIGYRQVAEAASYEFG